MVHKTLVLKVPAERGPEIERKLAAGAFSFRTTPHALYSAKGEGVVATHYRSGKFVIQGEHPEAFAAAYVGGELPVSSPGRSDAPREHDHVLVGSDESGKGDYFGPLIVAAVRLEPELSRKLAQGEVRDCKTMSDESVLRVGAALRAKVPFAIARLDPPEYNAEHARVKNLNPMLAVLHAQAIGELCQPGMHVLVDQFGSAALLERALAHLDVELEQRPRAEELLAVAAASVIAREQFLLALRALSDRWGTDLAKGAGAPVDRAAQRFVQLHGIAQLGQVAKVHFKNTQKIPPGLIK